MFGNGLLLAQSAAETRAGLYQWYVVAGVVGALIAGLITYLYTTRSGIIARATAKEAIRQPLFSLMLVLALLMLVLNTYIPFFSLGDDVKMLEICGLATILISGMILAFWTSSSSIAEEIEGKTAMTLLSKPINRRQFVVGKFFGIQTAVLLMLLPVVLAFLGLIFYKAYAYDPRESSKVDVTWQMGMQEVVQVVPGIILSYLEIAVMSAISVAISTRLPMIVNMVTCLAIFVVGHLTPNLVSAGVEKFEVVLFMARVIAAVLPAVDVFNIEAALFSGPSILTGPSVPPVYLGWAAVYAACYSTMAILFAFILFEDRDLA
jgi:ABC-type transport system involved in multi-copper enzyme maturation permease subunit